MEATTTQTRGLASIKSPILLPQGINVKRVDCIDPEDPDIRSYARFIGDRDYLAFYRWPPMLTPELDHLTGKQMFDPRLNVRNQVVSTLATRMATVVNDSDRYILLFYGLVQEPGVNKPKQQVVGGTLTDPSKSENEVWLNNIAIRPRMSEPGIHLGTGIQTTQLHEFFLHDGCGPRLRTNIYAGFNIPHEGLTETQIVAIQSLYQATDPLFPLLAEEEITTSKVLQWWQRGLDETRDKKLGLETVMDAQDRLEVMLNQKLPIHGVTEQTLRIRRDTIRAVLQTVGHDTTKNEGISLRLGFHLKQMLHNEVWVKTIGTDNNLVEHCFPTRRLTITRDLWQQIEPQLAHLLIPESI